MLIKLFAVPKRARTSELESCIKKCLEQRLLIASGSVRVSFSPVKIAGSANPPLRALVLGEDVQGREQEIKHIIGGVCGAYFDELGIAYPGIENPALAKKIQ
jgi:hypothetical protein